MAVTDPRRHLTLPPATSPHAITHHIELMRDHTLFDHVDCWSNINHFRAKLKCSFIHISTLRRNSHKNTAKINQEVWQSSNTSLNSQLAPDLDVRVILAALPLCCVSVNPEVIVKYANNSCTILPYLYPMDSLRVVPFLAGTPQPIQHLQSVKFYGIWFRRQLYTHLFQMACWIFMKNSRTDCHRKKQQHIHLSSVARPAPTPTSTFMHDFVRGKAVLDLERKIVHVYISVGEQRNGIGMVIFPMIANDRHRWNVLGVNRHFGGMRRKWDFEVKSMRSDTMSIFRNSNQIFGSEIFFILFKKKIMKNEVAVSQRNYVNAEAYFVFCVMHTLAMCAVYSSLWLCRDVQIILHTSLTRFSCICIFPNVFVFVLFFLFFVLSVCFKLPISSNLSFVCLHMKWAETRHGYRWDTIGRNAVELLPGTINMAYRREVCERRKMPQDLRLLHAQINRSELLRANEEKENKKTPNDPHKWFLFAPSPVNWSHMHWENDRHREAERRKP